ncbi:MAG: DNA-processing protein DprA [Candidatus Cybelea sp.]
MKLYVRGRLPSRGIAIVGSRTPPSLASTFAYALALRVGEPVVAGLAPGIDAAAHRGALAAGTPTVAFVAYGFGATDPPDFTELEEAIVKAGGAIATLLPPGTPTSAESRIARDRLQAEYARAVVLICSEIEGGALHTMRFARELQRARFAVVPPAEASASPAWGGNLQCIAEGATPLPFEVNAALAGVRGGI